MRNKQEKNKKRKKKINNQSNKQTNKHAPISAAGSNMQAWKWNRLFHLLVCPILRLLIQMIPETFVKKKGVFYLTDSPDFYSFFIPTFLGFFSRSIKINDICFQWGQKNKKINTRLFRQKAFYCCKMKCRKHCLTFEQ